MKHFTMALLLSLLLMLPTILTLAEPEAITVETSLQDELVSINDFILNLDGTIEELETDQTYVYTLDERNITIDLTTGYSLVNDQSEPYLLIPSELDESILNIMWFLPQQIEEEIFVPIQFIERVFNTTYDSEKEEFILNEPMDIEKEVEEEIIPPSKPVEIPFTPVEDEEIVEETPVVTLPIPTPPKQENPKPSTPIPPQQENPNPPVEVPEVPTPPIEEPETPVPPIEEPEIPDVEEPTPPDNGETVPPEPETPEQPDNPTPPVEEQPETPSETPGFNRWCISS